jgi:hypothetical protein
MRKVCILHHIEPMWSGEFHERTLFKNIGKWMDENLGDMREVILTTMEGECGYDHLWEWITKVEEWAYNWGNPEDPHERKWYEQNRIDPEDIIPALGHEFTYLYPWIKDLRGYKVYLMGGCQGECLQDLKDALDHLGIEYENVFNCQF